LYVDITRADAYACAFIYECNAWYLKLRVHDITFFPLQLIIPVLNFAAFIFFTPRAKNKRKERAEIKQEHGKYVQHWAQSLF